MKKAAYIAAGVILGVAAVATAAACAIYKSCKMVEIHLFTPEELEGRDADIDAMIPKEEDPKKAESEEV